MDIRLSLYPRNVVKKRLGADAEKLLITKTRKRENTKEVTELEPTLVAQSLSYTGNPTFGVRVLNVGMGASFL